MTTFGKQDRPAVEGAYVAKVTIDYDGIYPDVLGVMGEDGLFTSNRSFRGHWVFNAKENEVLDIRRQIIIDPIPGVNTADILATLVQAQADVVEVPQAYQAIVEQLKAQA